RLQQKRQQGAASDVARDIIGGVVATELLAMQKTLSDNAQSPGGEVTGPARWLVTEGPIVTGEEIQESLEGGVGNLHFAVRRVAFGCQEEAGAKVRNVSEKVEVIRGTLFRHPGQTFVEQAYQERLKEVVSAASPVSGEAMTQVVGVAVEEAF